MVQILSDTDTGIDITAITTTTTTTTTTSTTATTTTTTTTTTTNNVTTKQWYYDNRATGTTSKSFGEYLHHEWEKYDIKDLQKTAILGTASESANVKVQNIYHGKYHYI